MPSKMDDVAKAYVGHVLAVGQHDANYVDAYYGPPEWKAEAESQKTPLSEIREGAAATLDAIGDCTASEPIEELRAQYLAKQLESVIARVDLLNGKTLSFDDESTALYDVVAPTFADSHYASVIANMESMLPGSGPLNERFDRYKEQFYVPKEKLDEVFRTAVASARERTKKFVPMSPNEGFHLEFVTGEVWGGYNWFKGNGNSLIQINTDFPISIDRALHLACHEGYPGHHVYNILMEEELVRERNWVEFSVYALFSPHSLIAEGTAEYGVELSYPPDERLSFEQETLFPLAGLDPVRAQEYSQVLGLMEDLGWAANDAARNYLDGKATHDETVDWLVTYTLSTPERARQRIRFYEQNRSYIVTYTVGKDLVKKYVESKADSRGERWEVFSKLLSTPQVPSALR